MSILELDPHRETVAIHIERDVNVLGVEIRTGWIVKAPHFATGQNQPTNGIGITQPPFKPISKMDRAQFVLVRSLQPVLARGNQRDMIGWTREKGTDGRLCGDQRGRVKSVGFGCRRNDALRAGARPLNDRSGTEIDAGNLEGRVAEVEPVWCSTSNFAHADVADSGFT